ncbi:hypothetical protein SNEBB_010660 [Seison nebaliae]|nr:hypothetical protein SNEBB_010660 [Seison nebaliae]
MSLKCDESSDGNSIAFHKENVVDYEIFFDKSVHSTISTLSNSSLSTKDDNNLDNSMTSVIFDSPLPNSTQRLLLEEIEARSPPKNPDGTAYLLPTVHNDDGSINLPDKEVEVEVEKLKKTFFENLQESDSKNKRDKNDNVKIRYGANLRKSKIKKFLSFCKYNGNKTDLTNFSLTTRRHFDEEEMRKKKIREIEKYKNELWSFYCGVCYGTTETIFNPTYTNRAKAAVYLLKYIYYDLFISHQLLFGPLNLFSLLMYAEVRSQYKNSSILLSLSNNNVIRISNLINLMNIIEDHLDITCHMLLRMSCCKECICVYCFHNFISNKVKDRISNIECPLGTTADRSLLDVSTVALGCQESEHKTFQMLKNGILKRPITLKCQDCKTKHKFTTKTELFNSNCKACGGQVGSNEQKTKLWIMDHPQNLRNAIRCPECKMYIQKTGGCDHMCCSRCNCSFCYKCGKKRNHRFIPKVYDHDGVFGPVSFFGCSYILSKRRDVAHAILSTTCLMFGTAIVPVVVLISIPVFMGIGVFVLCIKLAR